MREEWHWKVTPYLDLPNKGPGFNETIFNAITSSDKNWESWSLLDIFNTKELSKHNFSFILNEMFSKLEKKTWVILFDRKKAECTEEWIKYINLLLNESLNFYTNYLLRNVWTSFIKKWSKNWDKIELKTNKEIRDFFTHSSQNKNPSATRQIHCSLLKIAYAINDTKVNEDKIKKAEEEFWEIKKNMFFSNFYNYKDQEAAETIKNDENNFRYIKLATKPEKSLKNKIFFNCARRVKKEEQILVKKISDHKYNSIDVIKDIYWIRNEVKSKEDALFLLEYIRINVLNKNWDFSHKNIFWDSLEISKRFIRQYAWELDPEFYAKLYRYLDKDTITWKNNKDYKDVKIRGNLWWHACEIQINLVDNKNETWYSHHLIFDCKKKIRALSRLQWYVPHSIIHRYIKEAINNSIKEAEKFWWFAELVSLWWYNWPTDKITEIDKENAQKNIFNYLLKEEKDILKLEIPWVNKNLKYYTSRSIRNYFHKDWKHISLYPRWAVVKLEPTWERTNNFI